ncbi:MAG TPA: hypothetical protein DE038_06570 [Nitrospina sp.]|nr:hypothetical protein [Nitrospina sp.]
MNFIIPISKKIRKNHSGMKKRMANPVKIKDGYRHLNSFVFYTHIYWGENESWLKFLLKIVEQQRLINK